MASIPVPMLIKYTIGKYSFLAHEGDIDHFNRGFFFNNDDFLRSRPVKGRLIHFELRNEFGEMTARMNVSVLGNIAYSPWKAPFGSVECFLEVESNMLIEYMEGIFESLKSLDIIEFRIIHYPDLYDVKTTKKVDQVLIKSNFDREVDEWNQHLIIGQAGFEQQILYSQRKRLKKCQRSGFTTKMEDIRSLSEAYELLTDSRERKNYPITMSFEELSEMFEIHPSRYLLFAVRDEQKMVAMAISILISPEIIYNFYHADHSEYGSFSPTVLAVGAVYEYCQQQGIDYIDLGISSLNGELNEGIYRFKKGLGAIDGIKRKYVWHSTER